MENKWTKRAISALLRTFSDYIQSLLNEVLITTDHKLYIENYVFILIWGLHFVPSISLRHFSRKFWELEKLPNISCDATKKITCFHRVNFQKPFSCALTVREILYPRCWHESERHLIPIQLAAILNRSAHGDGRRIESLADRKRPPCLLSLPRKYR